MKMTEKFQIERNVKSHNKIYDKYGQLHTEIFNPIEQDRIHNKLKYAIKNIKTNSNLKIAFDYGCGSGNLTKHLIELGIHTIAADISNKFLSLIEKNYSNTGMVNVLKINGQDLSNIEDKNYDLVATYSVLHHVPDYLHIVQEMVRVLKPGGIIYLDHEVNELYWAKTKHYIEFLQLAKPKSQKNLRRFLNSPNYVKFLNLLNYVKYRIREIINPRYQPEGDIHVYLDDHIEWDKIEHLLITQGCEIILKEDYLGYRSDYPIDIFQKYKNKCNDLRVLIARKK